MVSDEMIAVATEPEQGTLFLEKPGTDLPLYSVVAEVEMSSVNLLYLHCARRKAHVVSLLVINEVITVQRFVLMVWKRKQQRKVKCIPERRVFSNI